jgi:Flp pilus assembly protein TadD
MEAFQRGDYAAARSHFEELARLSPTNVTAYLYSGLSSMQLGELHLAEDDLRRAVELDPTHQGAVDSLVNLLIQKGALGEAAEVQSEFARRNRFDAEPLIGLGRIHRAQGDMASALEAHRRAVELAPGNAMALLELGVSLNQASDTGEARDVFIEVLELDNTNAPAYAGLGTTLVMEQRYSEAIEPLEMALQLDDDQAPAHLNLAIAYENLDRVEDSLREYEAFVRLTDDREKAARVGELVKRARAALEERQGQK